MFLPKKLQKSFIKHGASLHNVNVSTETCRENVDQIWYFNCLASVQLLLIILNVPEQSPEGWRYKLNSHCMGPPETRCDKIVMPTSGTVV